MPELPYVDDQREIVPEVHVDGVGHDQGATTATTRVGEGDPYLVDAGPQLRTLGDGTELYILRHTPKADADVDGQFLRKSEVFPIDCMY